VLAQRGASIVIADLDESGAAATASLIGADERVAVVRADVADDDSVRKMVAFAVERFGRIDCACNVAGISVEPKPFVEHTPAEWQRVIDVDLTGVFLCMQHEIRQMLAQGDGGSIVNVSSAAGVVPAPGQPHYTAAKHAVLGLTKHAAQEYARAGIRVNAVLPGQTETEPMKAYLEGQPDHGERLLRRMPMGRMARPDEIAESMAWLCSDASSYVNGVSLLVDGGLIAR
jgi:NAD(P)-dependent dehydrogenase (short-subunit alcohol dehydrogenase family)